MCHDKSIGRGQIQALPKIHNVVIHGGFFGWLVGRRWVAVKACCVWPLCLLFWHIGTTSFLSAASYVAGIIIVWFQQGVKWTLCMKRRDNIHHIITTTKNPFISALVYFAILQSPYSHNLFAILTLVVGLGLEYNIGQNTDVLYHHMFALLETNPLN